MLRSGNSETGERRPIRSRRTPRSRGPGQWRCGLRHGSEISGRVRNFRAGRCTRIKSPGFWARIAVLTGRYPVGSATGVRRTEKRRVMTSISAVSSGPMRRRSHGGSPEHEGTEAARVQSVEVGVTAGRPPLAAVPGAIVDTAHQSLLRCYSRKFQPRSGAPLLRGPTSGSSRRYSHWGQGLPRRGLAVRKATYDRISGRSALRPRAARGVTIEPNAQHAA